MFLNFRGRCHEVFLGLIGGCFHFLGGQGMLHTRWCSGLTAALIIYSWCCLGDWTLLATCRASILPAVLSLWPSVPAGQMALPPAAEKGAFLNPALPSLADPRLLNLPFSVEWRCISLFWMAFSVCMSTVLYAYWLAICFLQKCIISFPLFWMGLLNLFLRQFSECFISVGY